MSENSQIDFWLSLGLAFIGGYCDAAGYVLAKTFTGHITGTLVLAAISLASHDWRTLLRHLLAIVVFLTGVVSILISERLISRSPSRSLLPVVMTIEIVLISTAYLALTSHLKARFGLFVGCVSFALGLQNGAFSQAGGISVHTTYLTGMITSLLKTEAQRHSSETTVHDRLASAQKVRLLGGVWLVFVVGAAVGAAMVFWLGALGVFGAALLLLAMVIGLCVSRWRPELRNPYPTKRPSRASQKTIGRIAGPSGMAFLNKVLRIRTKGPLSVSTVVRILCISVSGPFANSAGGNAQRSGQQRDGARPARASLRNVGRRADAPA